MNIFQIMMPSIIRIPALEAAIISSRVPLGQWHIVQQSYGQIGIRNKRASKNSRVTQSVANVSLRHVARHAAAEKQNSMKYGAKFAQELFFKTRFARGLTVTEKVHVRHAFVLKLPRNFKVLLAPVSIAFHATGVTRG